MTTLAPPKIVVLDASVLINFLILDRIDLLALLGGSFDSSGSRRSHPRNPRSRASKTIADGHYISRSTDLAEIALAVFIRQFSTRVNPQPRDGQHRGWMIACDETGIFIREASGASGGVES
jgi:hypothetical protein